MVLKAKEVKSGNTILIDSKPASLPEMLWLAMVWLFKPYISHWKSDFDGVKNKDGQLNECYLTNTSTIN